MVGMPAGAAAPNENPPETGTGTTGFGALEYVIGTAGGAGKYTGSAGEYAPGVGYLIVVGAPNILAAVVVVVGAAPTWSTCPMYGV